MTDQAATLGFRNRLRALVELGKFRIVELWLGFFVGVTLLRAEALQSLHSLVILGLILLVGICVIATTCSLDDIIGVRDGVDQANQNNHRGQARWGVKKPILTGQLSERHAFRFVHALGIFASLAFAAVLVLAWPLPAWLVIAMPLMMLLAVNYSYGLKLSYHGAGEFTIFIGAAGTVLIPYALITTKAPAILLVQAALVGAWHAQVVVFSNTHDVLGDRATGRMTMAARTSERGNRLYIAGVFFFSAALGVSSLVAGYLPPAYAFALAPVWGVQAYQLWRGIGQKQWLAARLLGFGVVRLGIVALVIANLLLRGSPI